MYGDWKTAVEAGIRALDLADRNGYHRVQVRTWFALSPIAAASGLRELLQRAAVWFDEHQAIFPHSPFGNVMHGGLDDRLSRAGLIPAVDVDPEDLLPAWDESQGMPSWHAAVEAIMGGWLAAGREDAARRLLERIASWHDHPTTEALGRGSEAIMRARLLVAGGDRVAALAAARQALDEFRRCRAPWWVVRSLRMLDSLGEASREEIEEAVRIERALGLPGPAS
jgi:hypothetical protein